MSNKVFDELKNIIAESRKDWKLNLRGDGNYSLANNKVFAYFDYERTGVIIRAKVYPNNVFLKNYNDLISISPRVNKVGSWKDEIIDIQLKEEKYINDYFNLLQAIADKREYPRKRENNLPNNKNIVPIPVEIKMSNNQNLQSDVFSKIKYIEDIANSVKNYFYPTAIIKDEKNENNITLLEKGNFYFDINNFSYKKSYLRGESGSGKTFISLLMTKHFWDNGYIPFFIKCSEETIDEKIAQIINEQKDNKKKFIVFDDCHKLTFKTLNKVYDNDNYSSEYIILFTFSTNLTNENEFYKFFTNKDRNTNKFKIKALKNEKKWIKTAFDREIYKKYQKIVDNEYDLYSEYIKDIIINYAEEYVIKTNYTEFSFLLKKVAFKSLLGKVNFEEIMTKNDDLNNFIKNNKITSVSEKPEKIFFVHDRFRDILAVEYLLSDFIDTDEINFILNQENLRENKWKYFLSYYSFRINKTNFEKLQQQDVLISPLLIHLLSMRNFREHRKILELINPKKLDENILKLYYLHYAKNYYNSEGNYTKSIYYSLKAYNLDQINDFNNSEDILNQIMSCLVDIYLPNTGLKLFDIVSNLDNNEKYKNPNILGNKARFLLKKNEFEDAFKFLNEKYNLHLELEKNNPIEFHEDVLRDKADLILGYALMSIEKPSKDNYNKAIKLFEEVKKAYKELKIETDLDYDPKLSFIYRNLTYFLNTNIPDELKNELLVKIEEFNKLEKHDTSALAGYCINLGKYYYYKDNKEKAKELFSKHLERLEKDSYKAELYLCYGYLFFITKDITYKEKSLSSYNNFKKEAQECLNQINDTFKLGEELFSLKNIFEEDENIIRNLFLI